MAPATRSSHVHKYIGCGECVNAAYLLPEHRLPVSGSADYPFTRRGKRESTGLQFTLHAAVHWMPPPPCRYCPERRCHLRLGELAA